MIINKIIIILIFPLLVNCSDIEFVYKNPESLNFLEEKTQLSINGDDKPTIKDLLKNKLGSINDDPVFHLVVNSKKIVNALIVDKDATASKFDITYNLDYNLRNLKEDCLIISKTISTKSSYDSKSAGYSFGTDISEKETSIKNLESNLNKFLNNLIISKNKLSCNNAN